MVDESPVIESKSWTSSRDRSAGHGPEESASSISVEPHLLLERLLTLEIVRVAERAAVSAARWRGQGSEMKADRAAAEAMRRELNTLPIEGVVVIGDGWNQASALFVGSVAERDRRLILQPIRSKEPPCARRACPMRWLPLP
jgi:hypothetical protein